MTVQALRNAYRDVLRDWGFADDGGNGSPRVVILEPRFCKEFSARVCVLANAVERLAREHKLSIGTASDPFTRRIGRKATRLPTPFVARPDFIIVRGKPRLIELNVDSSLGGIMEVSRLAEAHMESDHDRQNIKFLSPMDGMCRLLMEITDQKDGSIIILSGEKFREYDAENCVRMAKWIRGKTNREAHVAFPKDIVVKEFVYWRGKRVCAMVKMDVLVEEKEKTELGDLLERAELSATAIVSDNEFIQVEDKASVAQLLRMCDRSDFALSEEEQKCVMSVAAPTWLLKENDPEQQGDWSSYLIKHRRQLVLKRCFSFGGARVAIGRNCTPRVWTDWVSEALREPEVWVAQQFLRSDPLVFAGRYGKFSAEGQWGVDTASVFSPFVFGRRIYGYLCRTSRSPRNQKIGLASDASKGVYMAGENIGGSDEPE